MTESGKTVDIGDSGYASFFADRSFTMAGLSDGQAEISAVHVPTGTKVSANVTVQTLKDKLYLIQVYPKTSATITYTTGDNQTKEAVTDSQGRIAIYEPSGLVDAVYATAWYGNELYTGVMEVLSLKSGEQHPIYGDLYPMNIFKLRPPAKAELYLKKPNGKPYTGKVTYRAGVYINGKYATPAQIADDVTATVGEDGKLIVEFDTRDFYLPEDGETNAARRSARDRYELIVEVEFEDGVYNPVRMSWNAGLGEDDLIIFGSKIVYLRDAVMAGDSVYMVDHYVTFGGSSRSLMNYSDTYGPSSRHPSVTVTAEFWQLAELAGDVFVELASDAGQVPAGQTVTNFRHPFSKWLTTRHTQILSEETMWLEQGKAGSVVYRIYKDGNLAASLQPSSRVVNMIGVQDVNVNALKSELGRLKRQMDSVRFSFQPPDQRDQVVRRVVETLEEMRLEAFNFRMAVFPTEDPLVYQTLIYVPQIGSLPYADGKSEVTFYQTEEYNLKPEVTDVTKIVSGSYFSEQLKTYKENKSKRKFTERDKNFTFSGYYSGELRYNIDGQRWEHYVLYGGFELGGGLEKSTKWNIKAGPVPVTFELKYGGLFDVTFKASALKYPVEGLAWSDPKASHVYDYLTSLRIMAYVELFGGVGFDYTVVAAKIGLFGRLAMDNTFMWLNREYLADSSERVLFGDKLTFEGQAGVRVVLKFLFFSFKHDIVSLKYSYTWLFNNWKKIEEYWNKHGKGPLTAENARLAALMYLESIGGDGEYVLSGRSMESRDYLKRYERVWNDPAAPRMFRALVSGEGTVRPVETNAYPYADPQTSADGRIMVYLSDGDSTDIRDTHVAWAERVNGGYSKRGPVADDPAFRGYGDSDLSIAGEGNLVAAVWVRQMQDPGKAADDSFTNEEMMTVMNSTEIMAAIYDGDGWTAYRLTDDLVPNLAPTVAVSGGRVFVAYRSAYSKNPDNPLDFNGYDRILYTVYDATDGTWSEPQTLYNGMNGAVKGLASAMAGDRALTAFVLRPAEAADSRETGMIKAAGIAAEAEDALWESDAQTWEIAYAVVDVTREETEEGWRTPGVVRHLQLTNDEAADLNPDAAVVRFADGGDRFVIGWSSVTADEEGNAIYDVRLAAADRDGELETGFAASLRQLLGGEAAAIHPNFAFAKMTEGMRDLDRLTILWKEMEVLEENDREVAARDLLRGVKLGTADGRLYVSAVTTLAAMPDYTEIDHIDAFVEDDSGGGTIVQALLMGTTYTTEARNVGTITLREPGQGGDEVPVVVSETVSGMYTGSGTFQNGFRVDDVVVPWEEIVPGFDLPVTWVLTNAGADAVRKVTVTLGGQTVEMDITPEWWLPNETRSVTVTYTVPADIVNEPYVLSVEFADGSVQEWSDTLLFDLPDTGVGEAVFITEADGKRELSIPVYDKSEATLAGKNRVVKLGLYRSNEYRDEDLFELVEIRDDLELVMVDDGGYAARVTIDVADYLAELGLSEIPDSGLPIYLRVWAEDGGKEILEPEDLDNERVVWIERLSNKYGADPVLVTVRQTNEGGVTKASLKLQNMNMQPISGGNVLLVLQDEEGRTLETRYLATRPEELLDFGPEEIREADVAFSREGHFMQAIFFAESSSMLDATLASAVLEGVPLDFDPARTDYDLEARDLKTARLIASAAYPEAGLTLGDGQGNVLAEGTGHLVHVLNLAMSPEGAVQTFTLTVVPASPAGEPKTYRFTVRNVKTELPKPALEVSGEIREPNVYVGYADVYLAPYDIDGLEVTGARYRINGGAWTDVAYDGSDAVFLTAFAEPGTYHVQVEMATASGGTFRFGENITVVTGAPDTARSEVAASSAAVTASGTHYAEITAIVRDKYGHALPGRTVTLEAETGNPRIEPVQEVTDGAGKAVFRVYDEQVEQVKFTVRDAGSGTVLGEPVTIDFVPGPADMARTQLAVDRTTQEAGKDVVVTIRLFDIYGHPLANTRIEAVVSSGTGQVAYDNGGFTDSEGRAVFRVTSTKAGTLRFFVRQAGKEILLHGDTELTFVPADLDLSKSSFEFSSMTPKLGEEVTVTVTLRDRYGNPLPGHSVRVESMVATVTPGDRVQTDAAGQAVFRVSNTKQIGKSMVLISIIPPRGGETIVTHNVNWTALAADPGNSAIRVESGYERISLAEAQRGTQFYIDVILRDQFGNPVEREFGISVNAPGMIVWLNPDKAVAENGMFTTIVNVRSSVTGTIDLTVMDGHVPVISKSIEVYDALTASHSLDVSRTKAAADGQDAITVTLGLYDWLNNPIANRRVLAETDTRHATVTPLYASTDEDGKVIFTVTGTATETFNLTLRENGFSDRVYGPIQLSFHENVPNMDQSEVLVQDPEAVADGASAARVKVMARDVNGLPMEGVGVELVADGQASASPEIVYTDAGGIAEFAVTDTKRETVTVRAREAATGVDSAARRSGSGRAIGMHRVRPSKPPTKSCS